METYNTGRYAKWEFLHELPCLMGINYPGTKLLPIELTVQMLYRHHLLSLLQELYTGLMVGPNTFRSDYVEILRKDVVLAWKLFKFIDTAEIIENLAEPAWGDFLIAPDESQRLEGTIPPFFPALVPVQGTEYRLLPVEDCPNDARAMLTWWEKNRAEDIESHRITTF